MALVASRRTTGGMTTITAQPTVRQPVPRITRRTVTSFVAGAVLAGGLAIGVNIATGDSTSSRILPVPASHVAAGQEPGCFVLRGAC